MRYTTRGIVLSYIKYKESSIIVKIFTELFGKQSYLVQGVRTTKPKHSIALFQPLMPLDMIVYHKKHITLQSMVEAKCHIPIHNILGNLKKATIGSFLTELLNKVLYEEESNKVLFEFVLDYIILLDKLEKDYALFYIDFMVQLCNHLGFGFSTAEEINTQLIRSGFSIKLNEKEIVLLDALLNRQQNDILSTPRQAIRNLVAGLVKYFQLHIDTLDNLKSLAVLQEISE